MGDYTDLLYARPSFVEGMARIIDPAGTLNEYNSSDSPEEADCEALQSDWRAIGQDLSCVIGDYDPSQPGLLDGEA